MFTKYNFYSFIVNIIHNKSSGIRKKEIKIHGLIAKVVVRSCQNCLTEDVGENMKPNNNIEKVILKAATKIGSCKKTNDNNKRIFHGIKD